MQMSLAFITGDWSNSLLTSYYRVVVVPIWALPEVVVDKEASGSALVETVERPP